MNDMMILFDLIVTILLVGGGIYAIYSCLNLKKEQYLFENKILYPSNCSPDDCLDPAGFIAFIVPRMLYFGVMCILFGIFTLVTSFMEMGTIVMIAETVAVLAVFVYIGFMNNRSAKYYW